MSRGDESGLTAINRGFYISAAVSAVLSGIVAYAYLPSTIRDLTGVDTPRRSSLATVAGKDPRLLATLAVLLGIVLAAIILWLTGHFTGTDKRPTRDVARTSLTGAATVVLAGIGVGLRVGRLHRRHHRCAPSTSRSCWAPARSPCRCSSSRWPAAAC